MPKLLGPASRIRSRTRSGCRSSASTATRQMIGLCPRSDPETLDASEAQPCRRTADVLPADLGFHDGWPNDRLIQTGSGTTRNRSVSPVFSPQAVISACAWPR